MQSTRPSSSTSNPERVQRAIDAAAAGPLAAFLHTQRWFAGKGRAMRSLRCRDHAVIEASAHGTPVYAFALLEVEYADGSIDSYSVPLVVGTGGEGTEDSIIGEVEVDGAQVTIAEACADDRFARALLALVARDGSIPTARGGAISGKCANSALAAANEVVDSSAVKRLRAEQSNTSIVFSLNETDHVVVKCLRRLPEGLGVEVEIGRLLTRVGFRGAPPMLGDLAYVPPPRTGERLEPVTLAVAQTFVANVGDGWGQALSDLRARFDTRTRTSRPPRETYDAAMRALGRTIAEMHLALASERNDSAFLPEPIEENDRERLTQTAVARLKEVVEWTRASLAEWPDDLHALGREIVERAPTFVDRLRTQRIPDGLYKIRVHGDLHLGQVLRVHEDDGSATWRVVDFEGEPMRPLAERRAKSSPLRDVAGMLRSFDYAAFTALREAKVSAKTEAPSSDANSIAASWRDAARRAFLDGWLSIASKSEVALLPKDPRAQTDAIALFELDKALYELAYEIENRPEWMPIPLRGIHSLVAGK